MATNAPIVRLDRYYFEEIKAQTVLITLHQLAEVVNYIGKGGAVFGQIVLPPDQARLKYEAMNRGR